MVHRHHDFAKFVEFFSAMSDKTRQKILILLQERESCVSDLVKKFKLTQPTISRHLAILERAGLVTKRRDKQRIYYRLKRAYFRHFFHHSFGCFCSFNKQRKGGEEK